MGLAALGVGEDSAGRGGGKKSGRRAAALHVVCRLSPPPLFL